MTKPRCLAYSLRIAVLVGCLTVPGQADAQPAGAYRTYTPSAYAQPLYSQAAVAQPLYSQTAASPAGCPQPAYAPAPQWSARPTWNWPFSRSAWAQVPVTSYRYVAANDPTTGAATLAPQPCQTYFWQPRPVVTQPYRTHSWFSWLHPWRRTTAPPACYGMTANYPCSPGGPPQTPGTSAYYPASAPTTPILPGSQIIPGTQSLRGYTTQPVLQSVPANTQPQLDPSTLPQARSPVEQQQPAANVEWPARPVQPAAANVETAPPVPSDVTPIPDAEAEREAARMDGVPALLSPADESDRSALQIAPNGRVIVPISWPANARLQPTAKPAVSNEVWDDSGWKSDRAW